MSTRVSSTPPPPASQRVKRLGRHADHSLLYECRCYESELYPHTLIGLHAVRKQTNHPRLLAAHTSTGNLRCVTAYPINTKARAGMPCCVHTIPVL
jgi:hypothetical protein